MLALAALLAGCQTTPQAAPAFDTLGGDVWTFSKLLAGNADGCREVVVESPEAVTDAWTGNGRFYAEVPLAGGKNTVRARCEGAGQSSEPQTWTQRLADTPKAWIRAWVDDGTVRLDAGRSERAAGTPAPIVRYEWRGHPDNPAPLLPVEADQPLGEQPLTGEELALQVPAEDGEYHVRLRTVDALGRADQSTGVFRVENGRAVEVDLESENPAWVDRAVVYGVVPFFFGPRGFADVTARLEHIAKLGANTIWLSPVNATTADDFGYAVTDYFSLRDTFGSEIEFRAMVDTAHRLGLRVIMDFVPNHVSEEHPYFQHTEQHGRRSPYYDWFERDPSGEPAVYFDWDNLKNLDYDNPEVQNHVIAAFAHWVRDYGIDGFRVDVGWGVRQRAPEFWERWREELKRIDPNLFLLAEAPAHDPYYVRNGFDAAYDWGAQLGVWAWNDVFRPNGGVDLAKLRAALTNRDQGYDDDSLIFRFLNNNDTGERFITRFGVDITRLASTLVFTLPGIPLIYTGDEIGAEYEPYDEGPPLQWRDRHGLTDHYTRLAHLRREVPVLRSRELELVETDHDDAVLAYVRPGETEQQNVLVALNFSGKPVKVRLSRNSALEPLVDGSPIEDLLTGQTEPIAPSSPTVQLHAYGALVLRRAQQADGTRRARPSVPVADSGYGV